LFMRIPFFVLCSRWKLISEQLWKLLPHKIDKLAWGSCDQTNHINFGVHLFQDIFYLNKKKCYALWKIIISIKFSFLRVSVQEINYIWNTTCCYSFYAHLKIMFINLGNSHFIPLKFQRPILNGLKRHTP
jgi:hypothetical protein